MKVALGCDHRGLELKQKIIPFLAEAGYEYEDFGCYDTSPVDYSDITEKVCKEIVSVKFDRGVLICSTGIGMSIAANKIKNIRAALCSDIFSAIRSRQHNDANVLVLGGEIIGQGVALEIVRVFLTTEFEGGRHQRRLEKVRQLETTLLDGK